MSATKITTSEPALTIGSVGAAVAALVALLVAFGVPISQEQTVAILGVVASVGPLLAAVLIRRKVWSPASLAALVPEHDGAGPAPEDVEPEPGQHRRQD